jgi:hypothetical protein
MKTISSLRFLKKPKLKILWFRNCFQRTEADGSLILKCLMNRNRPFFQKFKEPPNTVPKIHHPLLSQSIFWCVRVRQILLRGSITRSSKPRNVLGGSSSTWKHPSSMWLPIDWSSSISSSYDSTFVLVFCVCEIVCCRCSREYWVWSASDSVDQGRGLSFYLQISEPVHPFPCWAMWWVSLLWQ